MGSEPDKAKAAASKEACDLVTQWVLETGADITKLQGGILDVRVSNALAAAKREALEEALASAPLPSKYGAGLAEYNRLAEDIDKWRDNVRHTLMEAKSQ